MMYLLGMLDKVFLAFTKIHEHLLVIHKSFADHKEFIYTQLSIFQVFLKFISSIFLVWEPSITGLIKFIFSIS